MAFSQAQNFALNNATFVEAQGNYNSNTSMSWARTLVKNTNNTTTNITTLASHPADCLELLHKARAIEATHTSKTAAYAPKCKPGTRIHVITDIMNWATAGRKDSERTSTSVLWFQGPAGGGKTCIMREVVDQCQKGGLLAAAYFFSTRGVGLDNEDPFIATIVHQMTTSIPKLKPGIMAAIASNPTIFSESLDCQLEKLVVEPLLGLPSGRGFRMVIAVDGFDECRNPKGRRNLLNIIRALATLDPPRFRVVIASRPELDIRTAFSSQEFVSIAHSLRLQDYDGTNDVRVYLCDEFCRIRETHPAKSSIPESWPTEEILNILIEKSSGCYIYPFTVIKYVDNPRRSPIILLNVVLDLQKPTFDSTESPFAELDALYSLILHPQDNDLDLIKRILHCTMAIQEAKSTNFWQPLGKGGPVFKKETWGRKI
ncbi:hypothetical protein D9611_009180 [Ephemerocybe angulata]|uniref:Nephrocystin 3-like N-terminal domain-containing protein n=1 Tax=Ephemerocybe angulata TaxID=980116 RepID=A0A8H5FJV3_9AGAR|nr:hypothetical protein D9611_009180 [Tulosesus angulatus]